MKDYEHIISALQEKISTLEAIITQQAARIAELEKCLSKNSRNSSKPPRTTSLREKGKHKSGGQPGHKGETLKQIETPDMIKRHGLMVCPGCQ